MKLFLPLLKGDLIISSLFLYLPRKGYQFCFKTLTALIVISSKLPIGVGIIINLHITKSKKNEVCNLVQI